MKKLLCLSLCLMLCGCQQQDDSQKDISSGSYDLEFTARDLDVGYDEAAADIIELSESVEITQEGIYILRGTLENGQITVNVKEDEKVQLVLDNVSIHNETGAAIYIKEADKVFITLASGSLNELSGGEAYEMIDENNIDGVIFSKSDLTLNGEGQLVINAAYKHGIVSKDDLVIGSGSYEINAASQALYGKDCVKINTGNFVLNSGSDAIQSDNSEDEGRGYIYIRNGNFDIVSQKDGLQAERYLQIDNGAFIIKTSNSDSEESTKGIKSNGGIVIFGGSFQLDTQDDGLHAAEDIVIEEGEWIISSNDDGIHSDMNIYIKNGSIDIVQCYEGLEGKNVVISGGMINITASDDGINAADSSSESSFNGKMDQIQEASIEISGGEIIVDAQGDALDSNGDLNISGGVITLYGPTNGGNGTIDYAGNALISGGTLLGSGSAQMAMGFSDESTQASLLYGFNKNYSENTEIVILDAQGNQLAAFTPLKSFSCVNISLEAFEVNETYTIKVGSDSYEITLDSQASSNINSMFNGNGGFNQRPNGDMPQKGEMPQNGDMPQKGEMFDKPQDGFKGKDIENGQPPFDESQKYQG